MISTINHTAQLCRAYVNGIGKTPVIYLASFCMALSLGLVNLGLIFHVRETLGASPAVVGVFPALWAISYLAGCLALAKPLRRMLPRYLIIFSTGGMAVCFLAMPAVTSLRLLMLLNIAYGLVLSLFWPFMMGWMSTGHEGPALSRALGRYNLTWGGAAVFSPYISGWLSGYDTRWPFLAAGSMAFGVCMLVLGASMILPLVRTEGREPVALPLSEEKPGRSTHLRWAAWLGLAASFLGVGVLAAAFPVMARESLGLSTRMVGFLILLRSFANLLAFMGLGRMQCWHFRLSPMIAGQLLGVIGFVGLCFSGSWPAMGGMLLLIGVSGAVSYMYSMFHGVSGSIHRSARMAVHESVLSLGLVCGSIGGGSVYQFAGMRSVFALTAVLLALSAVIQAFLGRWALRRDIQNAA